MTKICKSTWEAIYDLMDSIKREKVYYNFAPCNNETFLQEYIKLDPKFEYILKVEFGITL